MYIENYKLILEIFFLPLSFFRHAPVLRRCVSFLFESLREKLHYRNYGMLICKSHSFALHCNLYRREILLKGEIMVEVILLPP